MSMNVRASGLDPHFGLELSGLAVRMVFHLRLMVGCLVQRRGCLSNSRCDRAAFGPASRISFLLQRLSGSE